MMDNIILGTVQIGLEYGVSRRAGLMPLKSAADLLDGAWEYGCRVLDTAEAYGVSEKRLGEIGVKQFDVISKLAHLPPGSHDLKEYVYNSVKAMLGRVKVTVFEAVLLHNPGELLFLSNLQLKQVRAGFDKLKDEGLIRRCGVSVYSPSELEAISKCFKSDVVQLPCCPLDVRWSHSDVLHKLREQGVEIHVRSIFLQGLLLMAHQEVPSYFEPWRGLLAEWHNWVEELNITPLQAALRLSLENDLFDKLVVGAHSKAELEQQFQSLTIPLKKLPPLNFGTADESLLDPSKWNA